MNAPTEFELIDRYFRRAANDASVRVNVGDDGAVVAPTPGCELVFAVDMLVEGRHFFADVDPATLGHKTLAVNLSDLAAMGARPRWALLAGALPDSDERWLAAFAQGLFALAERHGVALIGGDTTRGPRNLCLTIIGEVPAGAAITRAGAGAGDDVYVSGELGGAALGLALLQGRLTLPPLERRPLVARLLAPEPRVALGMALRGVATASIDLSDGLVGDLGHILSASGLGAVVSLASIPVPSELAARWSGTQRELALACALAGGDDYELCFTAPLSARAQLDSLARSLDLPLTRIGVITPGKELVVEDERRARLATLPAAFDHFR